MTAVIVSVEALRHQDADVDEDVAALLQRSASNCLYAEIEKTTAVLSTLDSKSRKAIPRRRALDADEAYVMRRFLRQLLYRGTSYEDEFYKVLEETREVAATFNKIKKDDRFGEVERYLAESENEVLLAISGGADDVAKKATEITRQMNRVRIDPSLSAERKREELSALRGGR